MKLNIHSSLFHIWDLALIVIQLNWGRESICCRILNILTELLLKLRKQTNNETELTLDVISILNTSAFKDLAFGTADNIELAHHKLS